jgi:hypothetical protein
MTLTLVLGAVAAAAGAFAALRSRRNSAAQSAPIRLRTR